MDPTRLARIDDTDPRFIYRGNWAAKQTSEAWGISGVSFNETLHETASDGFVIFRFKSASVVTLFGNIDTQLNRPKPSWSCALDGKVSDKVEAPVDKRSFYPYCDIPVADGGEHQLTLNVTVPFGGIFEIDGVDITPTEELLGGETLQVQDTDAAVTYSSKSNWVVASDAGTHSTDVPDSSLQFNFTGSAVQFVSVLDANRTQSSGAYTLDDGPAKSFTISGPNDAALFNRILFSETGLPMTAHSLNVSFTGQRGQMSLRLGFFYITLPPGQSALESSATVIELPPNESTNPTPHKPVRAIVGGIIGGVAGLVIVIATVFFLWRRNRRLGARDGSETSGVTPFVENKPREPTPPVISTQSPPSSAPNESLVDGKQGPAPVILTYDRSRVDILHEDSGYRAGDPSAGGPAWPVEVRDIPPVYSPV